MKPDTDIDTDTEKYSGHAPDDIKKNPVSPVAKIKFIAARNAIRNRNGIMGQCADKKISYYTFPPNHCTSPPLKYILPPSK